MYKIIALDLDGTLFNSKKEISVEDKQTLKQAKELGVKVVISTGRPYQGIQHVIKQLELENTDTYVICFNGGLIYHLKTNTVVYSSSITGKDVKALYSESLKNNINIHAFKDNQVLIAPKPSKYTDVEMNINNIGCEYCDFNDIKDEDLFIKAMLVDPEEIIDKTKSNLDSSWFENYSVVRSAPYFLEFSSKKAHKGAALTTLANMLNIDIKDTAAFGDAGNDLTMIQAAGTGVCMANGMQILKDVADFITISNDESGVSYAIKKLGMLE